MIFASALLPWKVFIITLFAIAGTGASQASARLPNSVDRPSILDVYRLHQRHVSDFNRTDPSAISGPTSTLDGGLAYNTASADVPDMDTPATVTKVSFVTQSGSDWDKESPTEVIIGGVVASVAIIGLFIAIGLCIRRRRKPKGSVRDT